MGDRKTQPLEKPREPNMKRVRGVVWRFMDAMLAREPFVSGTRIPTNAIFVDKGNFEFVHSDELRLQNTRELDLITDTLQRFRKILDKWKEEHENTRSVMAGVFEPDKLKKLEKKKILELRRPVIPLQLRKLDDMHRIIQQSTHSPLYDFMGRKAASLLNTVILERMLKKKIPKETDPAYEMKISTAWERLTQSAPLGTKEGASSLHLKGERTERVKDLEGLSALAADVGRASHAYWRTVDEKTQTIVGVVAREMEDDDTKGEFNWRIREKARLDGFEPNALVNNGLDTHADVDDMRKAEDTETNRFHKFNHFDPTDVAGKYDPEVEVKTAIDIEQAKVLVVGPDGRMMTLDPSVLSDKNMTQQKIAELLSEKRTDASATQPSIWDCIRQAGAGYGYTADERFSMLELTDANGHTQSFKELLRNVTTIITVGGDEEANRTWSLFAPDVYHFKADFAGGVKLDEIQSWQGHYFMDGMPHVKKAANLSYLLEHQEVVEKIIPYPGEHAVYQEAPVYAVRTADRAEDVLKERIMKNPEIYGERMNGEVVYDLDGARLVEATTVFAQETGRSVDTELRKIDVASNWVEEYIPKESIDEWARESGQKPEDIKEKIVRYVAAETVKLPDYTRITPGYLMALAQTITLSRYDLPSVHFIAAAFEEKHFINSRLGAAIMILNQEQAEAYNRIQKILREKNVLGGDGKIHTDEYDGELDQAIYYYQQKAADLALMIRSGVAAVAAGNGVSNTLATAVEPPEQEKISKAAAIIPKATGSDTLPSEVLFGAGVESSLVAPKGNVLFDPAVKLRDMLFSASGSGHGLIIDRFRTVRQGRPTHGLSIGTVQTNMSQSIKVDPTENDAEFWQVKPVEKVATDVRVNMTIQEPLILKWLVKQDPEWIDKLLTVSNIKSPYDAKAIHEDVVNGNTALLGEVMQMHYRTSSDMRLRLQPVIDQLTQQIAREYQETLSMLTAVFSYRTDYANHLNLSAYLKTKTHPDYMARVVRDYTDEMHPTIEDQQEKCRQDYENGKNGNDPMYFWNTRIDEELRTAMDHAVSPTVEELMQGE